MIHNGFSFLFFFAFSSRCLYTPALQKAGKCNSCRSFHVPYTRELFLFGQRDSPVLITAFLSSFTNRPLINVPFRPPHCPVCTNHTSRLHAPRPSTSPLIPCTSEHKLSPPTPTHPNLTTSPRITPHRPTAPPSQPTAPARQDLKSSPPSRKLAQITTSCEFPGWWCLYAIKGPTNFTLQPPRAAGWWRQPHWAGEPGVWIVGFATDEECEDREGGTGDMGMGTHHTGGA